LCRQSDLVIGHTLVHELALACEKMQVPRVTVSLAPMYPSRFITPGKVPYMGKTANLILWKLAAVLFHKYTQRHINPLRRREGLAPVTNVMQEICASGKLNLTAVSQAIVPTPADWPVHNHITGFLNIPESTEAWDIPADLQDFLNTGPTPIYIGFGSMMTVNSRAQQTVELLVAAVKQAGCRAIIQAKWEEINTTREESHIYPLGDAPHKYLFPLCALIVHHGGSGTTQSAALAGVPQLIVPHIADQFFWADQLQRKGVSLSALPRHKLTAVKLARKISLTLNGTDLRNNAAVLGQEMRAENGVTTAAGFIENISGS